MKALSKGPVAILVLAALIGLGTAGFSYKRYADEWLRPLVRPPRCVLPARLRLRKPVLASGTEPHDTPSGETVYLTPGQDEAVRCLKSVSKPLAAQLTAALVEEQPEVQGLEMLKLLRDQVPRDTDHDREAVTVYYLASAAVRGLPELPETKAALAELDLLHVCRFDVSRKPCPSRPPVPALVWIAGVPSSLVLLGMLGLLGRAGIMRAVAWRRARKDKAGASKDGAKPAQTGGASEGQ